MIQSGNNLRTVSSNVTCGLLNNHKGLLVVYLQLLWLHTKVFGIYGIFCLGSVSQSTLSIQVIDSPQFSRWHKLWILSLWIYLTSQSLRDDSSCCWVRLWKNREFDRPLKPVLHIVLWITLVSDISAVSLPGLCDCWRMWRHKHSIDWMAHHFILWVCQGSSDRVMWLSTINGVQGRGLRLPSKKPVSGWWRKKAQISR